MSNYLDEIFLMMNEHVSGGVVNSAEMARDFAELILRNRSHIPEWEEEVKRQLSLLVEDQGDAWLVYGSARIPASGYGFGRWEIAIRKRDAKVLSMRTEYKSPPGPP